LLQLLLEAKQGRISYFLVYYGEREELGRKATTTQAMILTFRRAHYNASGHGHQNSRTPSGYTP
jgi:hypothetical protein